MPLSAYAVKSVQLTEHNNDNIRAVFIPIKVGHSFPDFKNLTENRPIVCEFVPPLMAVIAERQTEKCCMKSPGGANNKLFI